MVKVAFLLFCLCSTFANAVVSQDTICQRRHCIAVVDAGSTGSRLHIYAYDVDRMNTPIQVEEIWVKKTKPGIASIERKPEAINAYLTNLFAQAPQKKLDIYFYATGGMRLASDAIQQSYYQAVKEWVNTQTQWVLIDAKTITGTDEGLFSWLAVNYMLGALQSPDKPLVGVMDMGGASVQIAFPVEHVNAIAIDSHDLIHVDIYKRNITLFVHSFLGLGQTEVSHQFFTEASCFSNNYPLSTDSFGEGDAHICQQHISKLINSVHEVNEIIKPVIAENPGAPWYTISGLSTLVKNKQFNFKNNQFSSQDMLQQADRELCRQSWHTLNSPDSEYAFINCLTSSYYYGLVVNGYGLPSDTLINYMPDSSEPDWTLGVVLMRSVT